MLLIPLGAVFNLTLTSRQTDDLGISTKATNLPSALTAMRAAEADFALTTISPTASLPKSTLL